MLHSICQQIWKTQQWPQDWKMSVFIPISKKGNANECSNQGTIAFILHAQNSPPGFNSTWTMNFQIFKLDLEKAEEPEIKLPTSVGSSEKQESSSKYLFLLYWLCQSLSADHTKMWKILKEMGIPASWEICMQLRKQQLELDMEQQTGSK